MPTLVYFALVALTVWLGGLVALGAVAAPIVFRIVPPPTNAAAMTLVFRRFDGIAVTSAVVVLATECLLAFPLGCRERVDRVRGGLALAAAGLALGLAFIISPRIEALHRDGAVRVAGPNRTPIVSALNEELEVTHRRAEGLAKAELAIGFVVVALYVVRLRRSS